ncbi:MAG: ComF family protein [Thermomicrobiaceae bacterium]
MRRAIQRFKYNGEYQRGYDLGYRLGDRVKAVFPGQQIDLIAPVPLHPRRYRSRGFNQSAIVADRLADALHVPVVNPVERVHDTVPQVQLTARERVVNLQEAFELDETKAHALTDKSILIVDDVMTTGATLAAVAGAMQQSGCRRIFGLTLAREQ